MMARRPTNPAFANDAIHGPNIGDAQAARLRYLDGWRARERQLADIAEEGMRGYQDRGRGPSHGLPEFDTHG